MLNHTDPVSRRAFAKIAGCFILGGSALSAIGCGESAEEIAARERLELIEQLDASFLVGNVVTFGNLDWLVLKREGNNVMLITADVLKDEDGKPERVTYYDEEEAKIENSLLKDITWETSDVRTWCNTTFFRRFSSSEQACILDSLVITPDHEDKKWGTSNGGNPTTDKIFCLSKEEAETLMTPEQRSVTPNKLHWWLRTPDKTVFNGAQGWKLQFAVSETGVISGFSMRSWCTLRPAMWIDLDTYFATCI